MGIKTSITIDTHCLVWYVHEELNKKLSGKAMQIIAEAENSSNIYIPTIVLMEIYDLEEKERIPKTFDMLMSNITDSDNYKMIPFDDKILSIALSIKGLEIHDRIIFATAKLTESILVTKDQVIRANYDVLW